MARKAAELSSCSKEEEEFIIGLFEVLSRAFSQDNFCYFCQGCTAGDSLRKNEDGCQVVLVWLLQETKGNLQK